jgi:hypothetical protein
MSDVNAIFFHFYMIKFELCLLYLTYVYFLVNKFDVVIIDLYVDFLNKKLRKMYITSF